MNILDNKNNMGIINYCSKSNNFIEEYFLIRKIGVYCYDQGYPGSHYGVILNFYDSDLYVDVAAGSFVADQWHTATITFAKTLFAANDIVVINVGRRGAEDNFTKTVLIGSWTIVEEV